MKMNMNMNIGSNIIRPVKGLYKYSDVTCHM